MITLKVSVTERARRRQTMTALSISRASTSSYTRSVSCSDCIVVALGHALISVLRGILHEGGGRLEFEDVSQNRASVKCNELSVARVGAFGLIDERGRDLRAVRCPRRPSLARTPRRLVPPRGGKSES